VCALALVAAGCGDDGDTATTGDTSPADTDAGDDDDGDPGEGGATHTFEALDVGGPLTKAALEQGDIDIALLFSSDGAIVRNDWVALEDDEGLQPVDNFVPAVRTEVADEVAPVLDAVSAALTVDAMQELVAQVAIEGQNPDDVADGFLDEVDLPDDDLAGLSVTVGSANFPESEITAELYAGALRAAGATVETRLNFGARETYFPALADGDLDIVPEFVGTLGFFLDGDAEITSDLDATLEVVRGLAEDEGVTLLEPADADSVNTFVVTQATADEYGLSTVGDLADVPDSLVLGGPPECPERPLCLQGLIDVYGIDFDV
jgi:osmoprotectant transport system substrate-binding protein